MKDIDYTYKHRWRNRNRALAQYLQETNSLLDLGCGDKDILNFTSVKHYLGLDKSRTADIVVDFDKTYFPINNHFDTGLISGVLEYLKDPWGLIDFYTKNVDKWVILHYPKPFKKKYWKQSIPIEQLEEFLNNKFGNATSVKHKSYSVCVSVVGGKDE